MIQLNDPRWSKWCGGYGIAAEIDPVLTSISDGSIQFETVWEYTWNELHHQGDVGAASFAMFPFLCRIATDNSLFYVNILQYAACLEMPSRIHDDIPADVWELYSHHRDTLIWQAVQENRLDNDGRFYLFALISARQRSEEMKNLMFYFSGSDPKEIIGSHQ